MSKTFLEALTSVGKNLQSGIDKLKELKDYIRPEDYGAKGDGITDDSTAINNAIVASTSTVPYKTVVFGNKNYVCKSPIQLLSGTILRGSNSNMIAQKSGTITFNGCNAFLLTSNVENINISYLTFVGNPDYSFISDSTNEIRFGKFQNIVINSFGTVFDTSILMVTTISNIDINYVKYFGFIKGSDVFIDNGYWGISNTLENTNEYALKLNLTNSQLSRIYFTFADKTGTYGTTNAIHCAYCNRLKMFNNFFTQGNGGITYQVSTVDMSNNVFQRMCNISESSSVMNQLDGASVVNFVGNRYAVSDDASDTNNFVLYSGGSASRINSYGNIIDDGVSVTFNYTGTINYNNDVHCITSVTLSTDGDITFTDRDINMLILSKYGASVTSLTLKNQYDYKKLLICNKRDDIQITVLGYTLEAKQVKEFMYYSGTWMAMA